MDDKAPDDRDMESHLAKIELDLAIIKASGATKSDVAAATSAIKADVAAATSAYKAEFAELRAEMRAEFAHIRREFAEKLAETKVCIVIWLVSTVVLAQLLPLLVRILGGKLVNPSQTTLKKRRISYLHVNKCCARNMHVQ